MILNPVNTDQILMIKSKFQKRKLPLCGMRQIAGRKDEDIISAYLRLLVARLDKQHNTIWIDNCGAQNKNWTLFSMLVYIINSTHIETDRIILKYFEPGRTYM